ALPEVTVPIEPVERAGGAGILDGTRRGVVVGGDAAGQAAAALAEAAGWPLLADPSSGVRGAVNAVAGYRAALVELGERIEQVVVAGRPTLSRDVSALLARTDIPILVVSPQPDW